MATSDYDVIAGAVGEEEYKKSTWFNEPFSFARSERRCIRVIQRDCDQSLRDTLHALENVIALIGSEEQGYRFGVYKQWEADFLRHLLGYTTSEEERIFNETSRGNFHLCDLPDSLQVRMGKRFTALLRHGSPLTPQLYPDGTVELHKVYDYCWNNVNPTQQFNRGRLFAAFLNGNNKQRFFLKVYLNDTWVLGRDQLPWKIFIGCTQGHTTGVVQPTESAHKLSLVEL